MSLPYNHKLIPRAKEMRKDMTPQETKLWFGFLRNHTYRFQRQKVIDQYIADFYCHQAKLVVEADGNQHNAADAKEYDQIRTHVLEACELTVLRFTNRMIDEDFEQVRKTINRAIAQKLSTSPEAPSERELSRSD